MTKKGYLLILFLFISTNVLFAQRFGMSRFFRTGMRLTSYYSPSATVNDSVKFGMQTMNVAFILPVGGNLELRLREFNIKFHQTFLTTNAGWRWINSDFIDKQQLYNFSIGLTHVRASLKNGFWFYSANLGMVEDRYYLNEVHPYFLGALAKIRVQGLRKQTILGIALTYNSGTFLPIPILGINRKLHPKWDINVLLPIEFALIYDASKKINMNAKLYFSAFDARTGSFTGQFRLSDQTARMSYSEIRSSIRIDYKIKRRYQLFVELGMVSLRNLQFQQDTTKLKYTPNLAPFTQLSLHFDFGKSPIGSQLFGNEF